MRWDHLDNTRRADWADWLGKAKNASVYQSWGWGEFKKLSGWLPQRLVFQDKNGQTIGLVQVLVRRMPGKINFIWVPGGPVSLNQNISSVSIGTLHQSLEQKFGRSYLRCNFTTQLDGHEAYSVSKNLERPIIKMLSGFSVDLDLQDEHGIWLNKVDKKHRYYIKQSLNHDIEWRYSNDDTNLKAAAALFQNMVVEKKLTLRLYSFEQLMVLREHLEDSIKVIVGSYQNEPVSAAMVLTQSERGHYAVAATAGKGRELSAAYAMISELRSHLQQDQIKFLDFGGVAPGDKALHGVDHFKCGFGGKIIYYLGEWEAGTYFSRILGNLAVIKVKRLGI
jgi:lipid II:glycine glycyltransferase (peptidoglycan interpeptide bridge formation enzyme)